MLLVAEWGKRPPLRQWAMAYFNYKPAKTPLKLPTLATGADGKQEVRMPSQSPGLSGDAGSPFSGRGSDMPVSGGIQAVAQWLKSQPGGSFTAKGRG
jgi:hypothetical protein